jgi:hypothetical protein
MLGSSEKNAQIPDNLVFVGIGSDQYVFRLRNER